MEAQHSLVKIGALELRFGVDEVTSGGRMVSFEFTVPAGAKVPAPHYHREVDELVYGLSGVLTTTVDGQRREVVAGQSVFIPKGAVHQHLNEGRETARALIVMTPGTIGKSYFQEMADVLGAPPPDMERVKEIMRRHGLVPA